jgi:hypothetical protein
MDDKTAEEAAKWWLKGFDGLEGPQVKRIEWGCGRAVDLRTPALGLRIPVPGLSAQCLSLPAIFFRNFLLRIHCK